jgi:uncharacterized membrane protein
LNEQAPSSDTTGLDPKLGGLLSYIVPPITGIVLFLMEKEDDVIRWHAAQSIVFGVAWVALWVVFTVFSTILSTIIPIIGTLIGFLIWIFLIIGALILWVICLIKGYSGQKWRMPLLAQYADRVVAPKAAAS